MDIPLMTDIGLPVLLAIAIWWLSTGVILYLDGLGRSSFRWSMLAATGLAAAALVVLAVTSTWETPAGAYLAFLAALMIWGWNEMAFLMGYVSGPRREPCPPYASERERFRYATETLIDHEIAILASGVLIGVATWNGPNQFGLWTFAILMVMRLSTKLNIFLGAPNIPEEFLPEQMRYLASYFRRKPMNWLFPFSITFATLFTAFLVHKALHPAASDFETVGYTLLTTLMALAVLEHWLLYIPVSATKLWGWGLASHRRQSAAQVAAPSAAPTIIDRAELTSWTADLNQTCDAKALGHLLDNVVVGAFGRVERLDGAAQIKTGWLRFAVEHGQASLDHVPRLDLPQGRVTAIGHAFDKERLRAAFAACAA
jgi:putative photosynthetic complex assembly protein 2